VGADDEARWRDLAGDASIDPDWLVQRQKLEAIGYSTNQAFAILDDQEHRSALRDILGAADNGLSTSDIPATGGVPGVPVIRPSYERRPRRSNGTGRGRP
jgi:hypothetical protein